MEGLSWRDKEEGRRMKTKLMRGEDSTLTVGRKERRKPYPEGVVKAARNHWEGICVTEPAKHRFSGPSSSTVQDSVETVPTRLQDRTDGECYEDFKDECGELVKREMALLSEELKVKVANWPESEDKARRLVWAEETKSRFPGLSWYLLQKPPEVVPMHNHTTGKNLVGSYSIERLFAGLCKKCEEVRINYDSLLRAKKQLCTCRTKECSSWFCTCPVDEEAAGILDCTCSACGCVDCLSCQVSKTQAY